ncbi:hypothetical protein EJ06DRAFT_341774 [Trichodelitschia bisporula]|uniref:Uncharacterized protein n=1 Tax=Trichodelitschia bisporula TaxID=703511 RepID=A0A6G1I2G9_9PEZI|nr:hypothetical protein EJ06DRAFT_341774 [Trichodelitschia bisporula]
MRVHDETGSRLRLVVTQAAGAASRLRSNGHEHTVVIMSLSTVHYARQKQQSGRQRCQLSCCEPQTTATDSTVSSRQSSQRWNRTQYSTLTSEESRQRSALSRWNGEALSHCAGTAHSRRYHEPTARALRPQPPRPTEHELHNYPNSPHVHLQTLH